MKVKIKVKYLYYDYIGGTKVEHYLLSAFNDKDEPINFPYSKSKEQLEQLGYYLLHSCPYTYGTSLHVIKFNDYDTVYHNDVLDEINGMLEGNFYIFLDKKEEIVE